MMPRVVVAGAVRLRLDRHAPERFRILGWHDNQIEGGVDPLHIVSPATEDMTFSLRGLIDLHSYLVIDFEGVRAISEAAARELFVKLPQYSGTWVQSINLEPSVARTVLNVVRRGD